MSNYTLSFEGRTFWVSIERVDMGRKLCLPEIIKPEILEIHHQAMWVTAPRVAHLPAR